MSNKTLTRADLNKAIYSRNLIKPAVEALRKINAQSVGYDKGSFSEIKAFTHWLSAFITCADDVINMAEVQYDNRPRDLINAASIRLSEIPGIILREQRAAQFALEAYQLQTEELTKKGFDTEQRAKIIYDPWVAIDLSNSVVEALNIEAEQLKAYLADAPRYSIELLKGTTIVLTAA